MKTTSCPGGESWNGLTDRALQALAPILAQGKDTVIVAHGGVIGGADVPLVPRYAASLRLDADPGHGYQITFEDGKKNPVIQYDMEEIG